MYCTYSGMPEVISELARLGRRSYLGVSLSYERSINFKNILKVIICFIVICDELPTSCVMFLDLS